MKIELARASRRPAWPIWAICLVLVWLVLGSITVWLSAYTGQTVQLCLFKRSTGIACPTCGLTRGLLSLLQGEIAAGWLYNPLLFSIITIFFAGSVTRVISGRSVRVQLTPTERRVLWVLAIAMVLVNWTYVAFYVG